MKKFFIFLTLLCLLFGLSACGGKVDNVEIDYGQSAIYSKEDMDAAIKLIKREFSTWNGCELHSIRYTSDECNSQENLDWMNSLGEGSGKYTQCIEFVSDFHSADSYDLGFNPDEEYTGWGWWLARTDGGKWELMTWGY